MNVEYFVAAQAVQRDGKRYALVEIIDENTSGPCEQPPNTRVRINPAGKLRALATLMGTPLMGPPAVGHAAERIVGSAADWSSNGATKVLYEIPDPTDWERMRSGEWGPVSPEMMPTKAHYEGDTYVLDDWAWNRVAFVPRGAFPSAGVKSTCIGDPRLCDFIPEKPYGFYGAVAAALNPSGRRFDAMKPTVGDLVGKNVNDSRMQIDASALSGLSSRSLGVVQAMISSKPFDPMKPTIGDLVGSKNVEAAANSPPVTRRINGKLDLSQPTVGNLVTKTVRAHAISVEPDDFVMHPRRIRMCSR